jgi:hypothetical protein
VAKTRVSCCGDFKIWYLRLYSYNADLQALLGEAQTLEIQRLAMEADLQVEFSKSAICPLSAVADARTDTPLLELKTSPFAPGLFVHVPIKKGNAGLVEEDDRLIPLRTNKTAKTYIYGVSRIWLKCR